MTRQSRDAAWVVVTVELLNRAAQETIGKTIEIDEPTIRDALDPEIFVRTRVTVGSVSPTEVNRLLEVARTGLADDGAWLAGERTRLARAATKLDAAVHAIISAWGGERKGVLSDAGLETLRNGDWKRWVGFHLFPNLQKQSNISIGYARF